MVARQSQLFSAGEQLVRLQGGACFASDSLSVERAPEYKDLAGCKAFEGCISI